MADEITQVTGEGNATPQNAEAAAEPRTFTQEEVNAIVERRVARVKATPPADYEDLRAKAAKLDELEAANKSELERAQDAVSKAKAARDDWKAKYEGLQAQVERTEAIRAAATAYGVDPDMLNRMEGDVEDNAKFLKARYDARPKFGDMTDGGEQPSAGMTMEDIRKIKDPAERVRARAEYISRHPRG